MDFWGKGHGIPTVHRIERTGGKRKSENGKKRENREFHREKTEEEEVTGAEIEKCGFRFEDRVERSPNTIIDWLR